MKAKIDDDIYVDNKDLLKLILVVGNKVVLQRQLREVCIKLNLSRNKDSFNDLINDLENAKLIEILPYKGDSNNNKFIMLKNPCIKWLADEHFQERNLKLDTTSVGKKITNNRKSTSMYKMQWVIRLLNSKTALNRNINTVDSLFDYLYKETTILHGKHRGLEIYKTFILQNEDVINLQQSEKDLIEGPLLQAKEKRVKGVPDKKGKTKGYSERKIETIESNVKKNKNNKNNNKKEDDKEPNNDFNSFLERNSFLRIIHCKEVTRNFIENNKKVEKEIVELKLKMFIFDVSEKLDVSQVGERVGKTYNMLKKYFGQYQYFESSKCATCKNNKNSDYYIPQINDFNTREEIYCIKPEGLISSNYIYNNCKYKPKFQARNITLKVEVICMDEKAKKDLERDCLSHGRTSYTKELRKDNKVNFEILKEGVSSSDLRNNINIDFSSFDFDVKFDNAETHKNIEKYNNKKKAEKKKLQDANEKLLKLYDKGLIDKLDNLLEDEDM